jgi:hypothetical protein
MPSLLRHIAPLAFLLLPAGVAHAQLQDTPLTTLTEGARTVQFVGGVDGRVTQLLGQTTVLTGGRLGLLVNRSTLLAFAARANLNQNLDTGFALTDDRTAGLSFGYGGFEIGRVIRPTRVVHLTTSVLLGGGATSYHDRRWRDGDTGSLPVDGFWIAEPEVQLQVNVTRAMRIAVGGSYRAVHGARLAGPADRDLRGASGSLTFTFGRF